jgi:hypothetical protein
MWMEAYWQPSGNLPMKNKKCMLFTLQFFHIQKHMKHSSLLFFAMTLLATGCNRDEVRLKLINPLDAQLSDASLTIRRSTIEGWIQVPPERLPLLTDTDGSPLPCQVDDLDGDDHWDELFVLTDLEPAQEKAVRLIFVKPGAYPSFEFRTNLRMGANRPGYPELDRAERLEGITYHNHSRTGEVYQMEGPAWENDRVGFRNYLDQRNGMDIFGKLTARMVLDSVGIAGRQSYHEPDAWGMDVLKVGTSLGAGSIAYQFRDSLYRVGDNGSGNYRSVIEGPLRSLMELDFSGWMVLEHAMDIMHRIDIEAGTRFYTGRIRCPGSGVEMDPVTGIVNMKSDSLHVLELNEGVTGFLTHAPQSEDTTMLAMALLVPSAIVKEFGETGNSGDGITETYYVVMDPGGNEEAEYRFYALWEKEDPRWSSLQEVTAFLKLEADRWTDPVRIEKTK